MIQLACTHCSHRFELETIAGAVCPSCGWSSSVVPASDLESASVSNSKQKKKAEAPHWFVGFLFFCLKVLLLIGIIALIVIAARSFLKSRGSDVKSKPASSASVLGGIFSKKESEFPRADIKPDAALPPSGALTPQEEAFLKTAFSISDEPVLSDQDLKLLQRSIDLQASVVEQLPSTSWTLAQFKEFIDIQEEKFKMPLPRGYKKDLAELFEKTYATAYDLFLNGRIQQARDAYVASLGFPVYVNDVRKHRAVVLTMMRGFLNDTIAKIGALNFTLARQGNQSQSEQAGLEYARFQGLIRDSKWNDAMASLEKLEALLPANPQAAKVSQAPPYGPEFTKIDDDMKPSLTRLLQVPAWPFDVNALKGDLSVKKMILIPLTDPERKPSIQKYREAMRLIELKSWPAAAQLLKEVKSPEDLAQDADDKLSLIERLISAVPPQATGA